MIFIMIETISTKPYKINTRIICHIMLKQWLCKWWWTIALPVAALLAVGCFDLRFMLVAFIVIMVVIPQALFLIYFSKLLTPNMKTALAMTEIEIEPGRMIAVTSLISTNGNEIKGEHITRRFAWDKITKCIFSRDYIAIFIAKQDLPLVIPTGVIPRNKCRELFEDRCYEYSWSDK